ncbi:MAG: CC/Se motif family (seleno)protein [Ectothiorhodospiraceae bacterium]
MTAPVVRVDAVAARWLARRGGVVTVWASPRYGCCGGGAGLPVAEARQPAEPDAWDVQSVAGVTCYIDPALASAGPLTVRAEGFLGWRRLFVEGESLATGS